MMMTAAPVDFPFAARYGVMEGWWTLDRMCSPFSFTRTDSSAVLPSEPGAPLGQSRMDWCAAEVTPAKSVTTNNARPRQTVMGLIISNLSFSTSRVSVHPDSLTYRLLIILRSHKMG